MKRRAFIDVSALLDDLLNRLESKPTATRLLAYIDDDGFASVLDRDRFERELEMVERTGGIQIQRRRIDGDTVIAHVRLTNPMALYAHLGRQPGQQRANDALAGIRRRADLPERAQALFDELADSWARGVGRFGLTPGDVDSLTKSIDLVLAIVQRAKEPSASPIDFRSFSRQSGADSKALERMSTAVAALLSRLHPEHSSSMGLDVDELLATFGILKTPHPLLLSGPLKIAVMPLPDLAYYGVPPDQGGQIQLSAEVGYVLTIENYVSFIRHVREVNADRSGLVIYTGGFPARAHLHQIVRLATAAGAPAFHWGDMDAGGVRIFRHLEDALAPSGIVLRPHLMEPLLLRRHGMSSKNQRRLAAGVCPASTISALWDLIAETALAHEQESLAPVRPAP
ncbi:Wadjet anti-phage system protein JetD domain-containing protein [Mesorhizobium sp.]|uniref:Wadjet anti-phage system protein JetD domain-containing protein n=1 Tax=Mesorhizobium sp. TaxID=1871066 RepID=UPI0012051F77|nr:Wadjet anti-phage system protein JetD domain-containing protein [Mesorhizobium sp.]TIL68467.1 MAG: DUF2399 domain-containing protein [Mesorhizobium sp.]